MHASTIYMQKLGQLSLTISSCEALKQSDRRNLLSDAKN